MSALCKELCEAVGVQKEKKEEELPPESITAMKSSGCEIKGNGRPIAGRAAGVLFFSSALHDGLEQVGGEMKPIVSQL